MSVQLEEEEDVCECACLRACVHEREGQSERERGNKSCANDSAFASYINDALFYGDINESLAMQR